MPKIIENIRENILKEGKELLLEENYRNFNMRKLAKRCNLGLGTIYNYFANKEELTGEIFKNDWDKTLALFHELRSTDLPFKEKLRRIYESMEAFIGLYMSIFHEMVAEDSGNKNEPHEVYMEIYSKMEELIREEKKLGNIKSDMSPDKLGYFISVNIIYCLKHRYMTFDEMYDCMRI